MLNNHFEIEYIETVPLKHATLVMWCKYNLRINLCARPVDSPIAVPPKVSLFPLEREKFARYKL